MFSRVLRAFNCLVSRISPYMGIHTDRCELVPVISILTVLHVILILLHTLKDEFTQKWKFYHYPESAAGADTLSHALV